MFRKVERLFEARLKRDLKTVPSRKGLMSLHHVFSCTMRFHLHDRLSNEVLLVGLMTFWVQREAGDLPYGDSLIKIW